METWPSDPKWGTPVNDPIRAPQGQGVQIDGPRGRGGLRSPRAGAPRPDRHRPRRSHLGPPAAASPGGAGRSGPPLRPASSPAPANRGAIPVTAETRTDGPSRRCLLIRGTAEMPSRASARPRRRRCTRPTASCSWLPDAGRYDRRMDIWLVAKPWAYWISPMLAVISVLGVLAVILNYVFKVVAAKYPKT